MPTRSLARVSCLVVLVASAFLGCANVSETPSPTPKWPTIPEVVPEATTAAMPPGFGRATWAVNPAAAAPGPASTTLNILVWEVTCSSGSPTSGRMSPAVIDYLPGTVTVTIGVRPREGLQRCPGPPGTPAVVELSQPLGNRVLLDGGRLPPGPPQAPW